MEVLQLVVIVIYSVLVAAIGFLGFHALNTPPPNDETPSSPILELRREELGLTDEEMDQLAKNRASNPWPQNDPRRNHWLKGRSHRFTDPVHVRVSKSRQRKRER